MPSIKKLTIAKKTTRAAVPVAKKTTKPVLKTPPAAKVANPSVIGRSRGARGDALLTNLQSTIEKAFRLPEGSVKLIAPGNRKLDEGAKLEDLRARWEK